MTIRNLQRQEVIRLDGGDRTYFTKEGYLVDHPIVTRIGIFDYRNPDGSIRKEFRPPEEVFDPDSLASYKYKPVIVTHSAGYVDKDNVSDEEIGTITSEGQAAGDDVIAEIVIHDTDAMKRSGLRELSLGYNLDLEETPGEYNGEHYDAIQRNIRINHLALVANARAGGIARLNIDGKDIGTVECSEEGGKDMSKRIDGEPITSEEFQKKLEEYTAAKSGEAEGSADPETNDGDDTQENVAEQADGEGTEAAEPTVAEKIQMIRDRRDRRDADEDPQDLESATAKLKEQEEDIQTLLDCYDAMEAERDLAASSAEANDCKALDDENGEEPAAEEAEDCGDIHKDSADEYHEKLKVVRVGDKLNMDGIDDLSLIDMKKAIIKKVRPAINLDGKRDAYVNTAYDLIVSEVEGLKKDVEYQRRQMMGMALNLDGIEPQGMTAAQAAREAMLKRIEGGNN